jgi:hypothetical protein
MAVFRRSLCPMSSQGVLEFDGLINKEEREQKLIAKTYLWKIGPCTFFFCLSPHFNILFLPSFAHGAD